MNLEQRKYLDIGQLFLGLSGCLAHKGISVFRGLFVLACSQRCAKLRNQDWGHGSSRLVGHSLLPLIVPCLNRLFAHNCRKVKFRCWLAGNRLLLKAVVLTQHGLLYLCFGGLLVLRTTSTTCKGLTCPIRTTIRRNVA